MLQRADVYDGISIEICMAGAVGAAVVYTKGRFGAIEALNAGAYLLYRDSMSIHSHVLGSLVEHHQMRLIEPCARFLAIAGEAEIPRANGLHATFAQF